jgi:hypothetical protein
MKASEARMRALRAAVVATVMPDIYRRIGDAADKGLASLDVKPVTREHIMLIDEALRLDGYRVETIYEDSHDHMRPDKQIGLTVHW